MQLKVTKKLSFMFRRDIHAFQVWRGNSWFSIFFHGWQGFKWRWWTWETHCTDEYAITLGFITFELEP